MFTPIGIMAITCKKKKGHRARAGINRTNGNNYNTNIIVFQYGATKYNPTIV